MTLTTTIDGEDIATIRRGEVELTQSADHGNVGEGRMLVNDAAGTLAIVGQKDVTVDEDDCSDPVAYRGFVGDRSISRGLERTGPSREIDVSLEDLNSMLGFRGITGSDRKRPAETVAERGAWLMASDYVSGLFVDNGRCDFSADKGMDKADYTDQSPNDVLADMALAQGGVQFYVREFDPYVGPELVFRDDNASTDDTSTIHISNVTGEEDGDTIFYPSIDFALRRNPAKVKSKMTLEYARGRVVEERAATADDFNGERFTTGSNSNIKTAAKASAEADNQLWQSSTEEDVAEGRILVPTTHANLLNHGDRVGVRLEHLQNLGGPGITTYYDASGWKYCRVLELTRRPLLKPVDKYELQVRLSPQEAAQPVGAIVQRTSARATTTGCLLTFPNPVTVGNILLVIVARNGDHGGNIWPTPATTGPSAFFGAGAWTQIETVDVDERYNGVTYEIYHGLSVSWKVADSTSQSGIINSTYTNATIWELSGVDMASATVASATRQSTITDPIVMNAGSLGTVAVGDLAFLASIIVHNSTPGLNNSLAHHDWLPHTIVTSDFTQRWFEGGWDGNSGPHAAAYPPNTWFGDMEGDGSSVDASMTRPMDARYSIPFNITQWAAIGLKVPPV